MSNLAVKKGFTYQDYVKWGDSVRFEKQHGDKRTNQEFS